MGGLARFGGVKLASQHAGGGTGPLPPSAGQGILNVDTVSIVGTSRLDQVDDTLYTAFQGTICYVGNNDPVKSSVGDYYSLKFGQNLTPINLEVVNAKHFATTGGQWVRMHIPNDQFLAPGLFWDIDPTNGNDENAGFGASQAAARLRPLKTQAELNRRLTGALNIAPTIEIEGNIPNSDNGGIPNLKTKTRDALPLVFGRLDPVGGTVNPPIFSGAITGYVTAVPATNTPFQMTIASLPVSWTASGLIGLMIQKNDGSKTAYAEADLGAKTARISQPRTSTATSSGVTTNFVVGETVNVYRLFTIPNWPYDENVMFPRAGNLEIQAKRTNGSACQTVLGASGPFVNNCILNGVIWQGGSQGTFGNVQIIGSGSFSGFSQLGLFGLSVLKCLVIFTDSTPLAAEGTVQIDGANASIHTFDRTVISLSGTSALAIFDTTTPAMDHATQGCIWCRIGVAVYGAGNATSLIVVDSGSRCAIPAGATAATAGNQLVLNAVGSAFAAIPVIDIPGQCGVSTPT
jgi:hypothetical protein